MVKTASSAASAGSSRDHQQKSANMSRMKYSLQQTSSSAPSSSTTTTATMALPQCKVKRNYACAKCAYYTQNPRSFLHHQKNVHAERLKVYECSHCLYASKHSQKLQRHVQMVHRSSSKGTSKGHGNKKNGNSKPLLVPPVRIRVQRSSEKHTEQQLGELVIVENVDVRDPANDTEDIEEDIEEDEADEDEEGIEEEEEQNLDEDIGEEEEAGEEEEEVDDEETEDCSEEGSPDQDEFSTAAESPRTADATPPPAKPLSSKKQYKLEKQSANFIRCSVCPFGSHSQTLVNRHEKTAHLKKKFFRCMKCNYVTHMRARYTKHVKYHTMPIIKCADCDFSTPYKWNLDRHNRNHSTSAPGTYKCSHCSFSADIKQSLTVHETNHHVPPVGGVSTGVGMHRRRYRVGASDAPGSKVDGTEIVTYECTKDGGIVEIISETMTGSANKNTGSNSTVVKKTTTVTSPSTASVLNTTTATTPTTSPPLSVIPALNALDTKSAATEENKLPPARRPMPRLIPLVDQKVQRRPPMIIRLQQPTSPSADDNANVDDYYNVAAGQSALSDFASLIDDHEDDDGGATFDGCYYAGRDSPTTEPTGIAASLAAADRRPSGGGSSSSTSPKSKTASFFDKLKARVDETADLTCPVCRYESKCLSEFMRHQRTHGDEHHDDHDIANQFVIVNRPETVGPALLPPPLLPAVSAAALKSTRCQRCRKRCKTSAELVVHLATCRGITAAAATAAAVAPTVDSRPAASNDDDDDDQEAQQQQQHPMENRIFVWNTAAISAPRDEDAVVAVTADDDEDGVEQHSVTITPTNGRTPMTERGAEEEQPEEPYPTSPVLLKRQIPPPNVRKEGKMYKTVFKCPHCTFWAATASRFHVHIVGHLNRKPFECSCCAYRSNWRWDITKHIRLKSARKSGGEESALAAYSHQGAKVLMTDETGRRNYSKYNRYLTVMEMDITDGADRAAGGDCEDGKGLASKKSVGGGITRKRRTMPIIGKVQTKGPTLKAATGAGGTVKRFKIVLNSNQAQKQNNAAKQHHPPLQPPPIAGGDNRGKTVWKCKKCFFRDCDRLTVLNHVKQHYKNGEFGNRSGFQQNSSQLRDADDDTTSNNQTKVGTKKLIELNEISEQKMSVTDCRKTKTPITRTSADKLLLLSTNPKSLMLYDDENFLSCPLCDVACSRGELKDHIQRIHIPEETKYRCEYCPFWSEEKKAMLDHMMFAHEFDDGSVNTDFNASDINYQIGQRDESNSNSIIEYEDNDERIEECGSSNDTSVNMEMFDSGSGDNTTMISNMEVVYGTNDENLIAETVECKLGFDDNDGDTSVNTTSKSFEKTRSDNNVNDSMVTCEYSDGEDDEHAEDDGINTKTNTSAADPVSEDTNDSPEEGADQLFECTECWYFSNNKRDINAHKQLHAKRGALYSCTQCVFNVTKSAVLYNHYRYGHVVEEPELQYPEDSVVRAGQRDMILKNSEKDMDDKTFNAAAEAENTSGPPMVWSYNKSSVPTFFKVFKCRYCPHTNRRRHNTIEHERMHSDHPDHLHHREQQQRAAGSSITQSPMHPCKRCTYVCNNAGVLASHTKVHSTSYGCATVGFYDGSISDSVQLQALEHVIKLEQQLLLDKDYDDNYDNDSQDDTKYTEFDDPELKFCPYCPARFFFHFDLRCHIRFHKSYGWPHSCDCCSFTARSQNHVSSHEVVHCDEYAQRTEELLNSGYPVSQQFPRPSEYTESVTDDSFSCPRQRSWSLPQSVKNDDKTDSLDSDGRQSRRIKRLRNSDITAEPSSSPEKQELAEKTTKRRRRSTAIDMTANTTNTKTSPHMPLPVKTGVAMKTTSSAANKTLNNTKAVALKSASNSATTAKTKLTKSNYVRQFMCDQCPGRFFKSAALQYHKTLHGGPGRHHCRRCNYAVSTYGNLIRHEAVHRDLPPREKVKFVTSKVPKSKDTSTADNSASSATTTMLSPQELPPLVTNNTNDNYDDSNSSAAAQDDEFPLDPEFGTIMLGNPDFYYPTTLKNGVAQPKRYKCPKCPTAFDKRDQYAMHLTLHGAQDKYRCDKCDYSVKYTANFVQHQRKHARDAEIRKNFKQEAERSKMIAAQEKASNALRDRRRSTTNDRQLVTLEPRETKFRNEISDRQTAYELNAAYGPTSIVKDGSGETLALYRCTHCPYETDLRVQLERHIAHHQDTKSGRNSVDGSSPTATKRSWKRACRFCSYRTYGESDLTEHTRVHFLRSTGVVLASLAAVAANGKVSGNDIIDSSDHVEFHGKRIVYNNRRRENDSEEKDDDNAVDNDVSQPVVDEDPFFVFKDRGTDYAIGTGAGSNNTTTGKPSRFSPEVKRPKMLIDINDNRTSGCATDKTEKEKTSFVRFINGGKRLELLDNRNEVDTPPPIEIEVKKKKSKK